MDSGTRIGFDERDEAVRRLQDHHAAGRLEMAEFDERMQAALQSRTAGEVAGLFQDLPDAGWIYGRTQPRTPVVPPKVPMVTRVVEVPTKGSAVGSFAWLIPLALLLVLGIGFRIWPMFLVFMFGMPFLRGMSQGLHSQQRVITYPKGDVEAEIRAMLGLGLKIPAVKRYRELTGADLPTAKFAVDEIERRRLER